MSTKIFDAWRVPTQDIAELTALGRKLQEIQFESYVSDVIQRAYFPWHQIAAKELAKQDTDFTQTARELRITINELVGLMRQSPFWQLPEHLREYLNQRISAMMKDTKLSLSEKGIESLTQLVVDVSEAMCRSNPALVFIKGDNGSTYLKGFGLTSKAAAYLDGEYQNFEYTNQTEMPEGMFDADVQSRYRAETDEHVKCYILAAAQDERGRLWDAALEGHIRFAEVGLTFSLDACSPEMSTYKIVSGLLKYVLEESTKTKE